MELFAYQNDGPSSFMLLAVLSASCLLFGLVPAVIAQSKGHEFLGWYIFGVIIFVVALPMAIMLPKSDDLLRTERQADRKYLKKCPECAEWVKKEAKVCRYCGVKMAPASRDDV